MAECAKTFTDNQPDFYLLLNKLIHACLNKEEPESYHEIISFNQAINHPLGLATQALMNDIFNNKPQDGGGLNKEQRSILELLITSDELVAGNAKYIIGEHAVSLFRLDLSWAKRELIPQYNWLKPSALNYWKGLLLSPRDNKAILELIKPYYLETANHYLELEEVAAQYVSFTIYIQFADPNYFNSSDLVSVFAELPNSALEAAAHYLSINQVNSPTPERYWNEKVKPFYLTYWPKDTSKLTAEISDNMLRLVLAADHAFPDAYEALKSLLAVQKNNYSALCLVHESSISSKYPEQALELIGKLITRAECYDSKHLEKCLNDIKITQPKLELEPEFKRLDLLHRARL